MLKIKELGNGTQIEVCVFIKGAVSQICAGRALFLYELSGFMDVALGKKNISTRSRDPNLCKTPSTTQGNQLVFEKNDGWKDWGINP